MAFDPIQSYQNRRRGIVLDFKITFFGSMLSRSPQSAATDGEKSILPAAFNLYFDAFVEFAAW